jgi:DNA-binding transcriptional regulator PaaX
MVGLLAVAPNVLGAMAKTGMLPSPRQKDVVNRSCDRMVRAGLLEWHDKKLQLTAKGDAHLRQLKLRLYDVPRPRRWDKKWRVLVFDIPEYRKNLRKRVRDTLRWIGFVRLQDSVWVYPFDCEDLITLLKADFKIGRDMLYIIADAIEQDKSLKREFNLK